MSVNKAIILGNVGKDPAFRTTEAGPFANFTVATTEYFTDREGQRGDRTEWHNIACFGRLAEVVHDIVHSGNRIYIEGKLSTRSWTDKEGQAHYITEIRAQFIEVLTPKERSDERPAQDQPRLQQAQRSQPRKAEPAPAQEEIFDDMPF